MGHLAVTLPCAQHRHRLLDKVLSLCVQLHFLLCKPGAHSLQHGVGTRSRGSCIRNSSLRWRSPFTLGCDAAEAATDATLCADATDAQLLPLLLPGGALSC